MSDNDLTLNQRSSSSKVNRWIENFIEKNNKNTYRWFMFAGILLFVLDAIYILTCLYVKSLSFLNNDVLSLVVACLGFVSLSIGLLMASKHRFVYLGFLIPAILMTIAFAIQKLSPFGDQQILVVDLWHQYYPFLVDFQETLRHGGSLLYSWSVGLGVNFVALMSYYIAGPINLLCVFIPEAFLREFLMFAVVVRIGLASMFFSMFLRYTFKINSIAISFFGTMFGLCAFFMGYYWNVIWLDTVAITPLVIMGMVALMREGKFKLYTISLAIAIVSNYYIALFLCYFTLLCFIGYAICQWKGLKDFFFKLKNMAVFTTISLCISAFMAIPAFMGLQNTYSTVNKWPTTYSINLGATNDLAGTLEAFAKILSNMIAFITPNTKEADALPNIYCGILAIVLAIVFLTSHKISKREKIFNSCLLVFITLSFIIRQLDYIWHGFHFTNMIPYRFSFLFSFVLIAMAFRAFTVIDKITIWDVAIAGLFMGIIILISIQQQETISIVATVVITILILLSITLFTKKFIPKSALSAMLCLIVIAEMGCSAYMGVKTVTSTTTFDYPRGGENTANVIEQMNNREEDTVDLWRAEMTSTQTLNDGALNNYRGASMFSSMANVSITRFVEDFGFAGWTNGNRYSYNESSPVTNLFMNLKYLISRDGTYQNVDYLNQVGSSGNVKLLENTAYLPMGFMTNSELKGYDVPENLRNPFDAQSDFFKKATGVTDELYTPLQVVNQGHTDYQSFPVNKTDYGKYTMTNKVEGSTPHLKFNYTAPKDGLYCAYFDGSIATNMTLKVNETDVKNFGIGRPYIMCLGRFKAGDKISLYAEVPNMTINGIYNISVYCNLLNEDVFNKGYENLSKNTLKATEVTETSLKGTIDVAEDGLFYTSIPYEKGWTAKVDGKAVEITPVGKAMLAFDLTAGTHTVEISFMPAGLVPGVAISIVGLALLIAISILLPKWKRKRQLKIVKVTTASQDSQILKLEQLSTDELPPKEIKD